MVMKFKKGEIEGVIIEVMEVKYEKLTYIFTNRRGFLKSTGI